VEVRIKKKKKGVVVANIFIKGDGGTKFRVLVLYGRPFLYSFHY